MSRGCASACALFAFLVVGSEGCSRHATAPECAALLDGVSSSSNEATSETSISNAKDLGPALNHGRLDVYQAMQAWRTRLGLQ